PRPRDRSLLADTARASRRSAGASRGSGDGPATRSRGPATRSRGPATRSRGPATGRGRERATAPANRGAAAEALRRDLSVPDPPHCGVAGRVDLFWNRHRGCIQVHYLGNRLNRPRPERVRGMVVIFRSYAVGGLTAAGVV